MSHAELEIKHDAIFNKILVKPKTYIFIILTQYDLLDS